MNICMLSYSPSDQQMSSVLLPARGCSSCLSSTIFSLLRQPNVDIAGPAAVAVVVPPPGVPGPGASELLPLLPSLSRSSAMLLSRQPGDRLPVVVVAGNCCANC